MPSGKFTDPTTIQANRTLARKLIPVADSLRDLYTRFGLRPYKVRLVRVRWTGGARGVGTPLVEVEKDILPTPLVQDLNALTEIVHPVGLCEEGSIILSEISGRFTDDDLRFLDAEGNSPADDEEVYWEIEFPRPDGTPGERRRFFLRSAPYYAADRFQWTVRLERSHEDRTRWGGYE